MDMIFLWLVTFVLGFWIFKKINRWKVLPPGPWGLPIVGYLPFLDSEQPHLTLTKLAQQFGPIYGIDMGSTYAVIISDYRLIREAFAKEVFSGRAPLYLTHGIMKGNGIICAEGALWKDQRKLVTTWLKSFGMGKHSVSRDKLEQRIASGVQELLENVKEKSGSPLNLSDMITHSLGNVVNNIMFGFKFPPEDKTWHWFRQIQEEGCHEMGVSAIVNFLPFIRKYSIKKISFRNCHPQTQVFLNLDPWLAKTFISPSVQKTMQVLIRGQAQTHRLYASIIARRRKMLGLEKPNEANYFEHDDLFNEHPEGFIRCTKYSKHATNTEDHFFNPNILIPSQEECILDKFLIEQKRRYENSEDNANFVRDEQLHFLLADMFGAGLDTTSVTLSWFLLYMALYPEEQERVRKEILSVYPEECEVDSARLPKLMATVCEAQRIRSIVPVGIPHGCLQDTYLGNHLIPKGAMVIPLQWAVHMDPKTWEDPDNFKPNRFLDEDENLLKPQEFIPFQTGKRMCPGDELSRMIVAGFIVRLFRSFRLRLASKPPSAKEMQGKVGVTLSPPETLFICDSL